MTQPLESTQPTARQVSRARLIRAFTVWDRRFREDPEGFVSQVTIALKWTPETYGETAAAYLEVLLDEDENFGVS